jgi:hypothetical protein
MDGYDKARRPMYLKESLFQFYSIPTHMVLYKSWQCPFNQLGNMRKSNKNEQVGTEVQPYILSPLN